MSPVPVPEPTHELRVQRTGELFGRVLATDDPGDRRRLVDEVIVLNMGMADRVAARYTRRGVATEDLRQVAYAALTRAAQRFDPAHATEFASFAVPSMRGEIRRYIRDHAWVVRPTRRIQELQPQIHRARDELWRELGRSPRPSEIAERLAEPADAVMEALSTDGCFEPASLDKPRDAAGSDAAPLGEHRGVEDPGRKHTEAGIVLQPAIRRLSQRDRRILEMRFVHRLTQRGIAEDLGVTQMPISKLPTRICRDLRDGIGELEPDAG